VNAITNYLEKLGSNFLVAAMIPSFGWVIAGMVVFDPILRFSSLIQIDEGIFSLFDISIWVLVPTIIIGYTLTSLNTIILKIFEGYVFFNRFPFMRRAHIRKASKLLEQCENLRQEIMILQKKRKKTVLEKELLDKLKTEYYGLAAFYDQRYPPPNAEIMPTQFGNVLKASEAYPATRYGMDAVQFWPRLWHVIPDTYKKVIEDARNELSFLVNMSALSIMFYLLCIGAILFNASLLGSIGWDEVFVSSIRYILAGLFALICNWFFNRAALFSVADFGIMVRSAYDLFRLDLLEQFRLKLPKDSVEEYQIWRNLGELIVLGQDSIDFKPLEYQVHRQRSKSTI
jgi:hypothetical protein